MVLCPDETEIKMEFSGSSFFPLLKRRFCLKDFFGGTKPEQSSWLWGARYFLLLPGLGTCLCSAAKGWGYIMISLYVGCCSFPGRLLRHWDIQTITCNPKRSKWYICCLKLGEEYVLYQVILEIQVAVLVCSGAGIGFPNELENLKCAEIFVLTAE